jgi:hypothetical protein
MHRGYEAKQYLTFQVQATRIEVVNFMVFSRGLIQVQHLPMLIYEGVGGAGAAISQRIRSH